MIYSLEKDLQRKPGPSKIWSLKIYIISNPHYNPSNSNKLCKLVFYYKGML